jgi:small GTP-binding protein
VHAHSQSANPAQQRLLDTIDDVLAEAGDALSPGLTSHLRAGADRIAGMRFNLVVLGEFKRGKSTLINSLLGAKLLPTGVVPETSAITVVRHGPSPRLLVGFTDGREEHLPVSELHRFVTELDNPHNELGVASTIVETPSALLAGGVQLVDTPGIASVHEHNTEVAWEFLPQVDAALCVLDAEQPFTQTEREYFLAAAARVPRLLVIINKIDHLGQHGRLAAIEFIEKVTVQLQSTARVEFYAVSARNGEGIPRLRDRIRDLSEGEAGALISCSVARLAAEAATAALRSLRFEIHALELPLDDLRQCARLFEERADALQDARAQACDLLNTGVRRALEEQVNEPLIQFARDHDAELRADLHEQAQYLGRLPASELAATLDVWIDETIRERFGELVPRLEAVVGEHVRELQRMFAQRIEAILAELEQAAGDAFGAGAGVGLPESELSEPAAFTFKLSDVAHMLDTAVAFARRTMPGGLGRRLVVKDAKARLLNMADRHAGRLRSALVDRARDAVRDYERELSETVDDAIVAICGTVDRVSSQLAASEPEISGRCGELERRAARLESIAAELSGQVSAALHG